MARKSGTAGRQGPAESDYMERLCTCLSNAKAMIGNANAGSGEEGTCDRLKARRLDVHAFEMAVESTLFFEAVEESAPVLNGRTRKQVGSALRAATILNTAIEEKTRILRPSEKGSQDLIAALDNLSRTVALVRSRLQSLCHALIMTELCSLALVSRMLPGQNGTGRRGMQPFGIHRTL
jgi:hypothetical protein